MKIIMKEYGGILTAAAAALPLTRMILEFLTENGAWAEAFRNFISAIC